MLRAPQRKILLARQALPLNHSLRGTHARSLQEARIAQQACFKLPALPDAYRDDDSPETSRVGAHFRV